MDRRTFLTTLAGGLLAAPLAAEGQPPPGKIPRVGVLTGITAPAIELFHEPRTQDTQGDLSPSTKTIRNSLISS